MEPSDLSLLLSVRRSLADLIPVIASQEHKALLSTIETTLNELLLRQDNSFYRHQYEEGVALVRDGIALGLAESDVASHLPGSISVDVSNHSLGMRTREVTDILTDFVRAARVPDEKVQTYLNCITEWEAGLYRHRMTDFDHRVEAEPSVAITSERLQHYLREKFPEQGPVTVAAFTRLFGGFSKLTVMFSTDVPLLGGHEFVIRAEQASIIEHPGGKSENEYQVMRYAYEQGVRIPEPVWLEADAAKLGARFVVSRKAAGSIHGTTTGASSRLDKAVMQDLARELVHIHSIRVDPADVHIRSSHLATWAAIPSLHENVLYKLRYWRDMLDSSPHSASPLIERSFQWLAANIPDCEEAPTLVYGDYGLHNILIDDQGRVNAVLDWEVTHLGDRAQDLIWFIICLAGAATYDEVLALYYEAGGTPVSAERLRFYDVYMSFNLLIVCNIALARLDVGGQNPSLAEIGLRVMHLFAERVRAQIG